MKETAIFGGTFDPPTVAHQGIVEACLDLSDIDEVWLMPSGCRPDKPYMSSNAARLAMLQLVRMEAFRGNERLVVTDFEQNLPQPTQTYETVQSLSATYPNRHFWFVYGADAYHSMPSWEGGEWLRRNLDVLLVPRPGHPLPSLSPQVRHLEVAEKEHDVSSSGFHAARQAGLPLEQFVSGAVLRHIETSALYEARAAAQANF